MKRRYLSLLLLSVVLFTACSDSFLSREPDGSTLTKSQYENLDDMLDGTVRGVWPLFYAYGGGHDAFGVRSIDLHTDIFAGDVAMSSSSYGWFRSDEIGQTVANESGSLWSFYFQIIRLCNMAINVVEDNGGFVMNDNLTEQEKINSYNYAQLLSIRSWCYANLLKLFVNPSDVVSDDDYAIPLYDEIDTRADSVKGNGRSTVGAVYEKLTEDLLFAINTFESLPDIGRESKFEFDADVARLVLAYAYINWGGADHYDLAFNYAKQVIDGGHYSILPHSELFTTGFSNVNSNNWLWGKDVTVENTTSLASFFGQVDIHSYSYAMAGDQKSIDSQLYKSIQDKGWDDRANWFRSVAGFKLVPDRKFFSLQDSVAIGNDRDWLSDDVWMRTELAYLIAAESAIKRTNQSLDTALIYLDAIMSERIKPGQESAYQTYKASLTTESALTDALIYNWRVELWGEGYSLQTLRRIEKSRQLGTNHLTRKNADMSGSDPSLTFIVPTSETRYNRSIGNEDTRELKRR
jgi:hypothetical protein